MMRVIQIHRTGGPEVLEMGSGTAPEPGPGQLRVRLAAAGVNFIDVYHRMGAYPLPLPFTPGMEGAGVVEAVGPGVTGWEIGDRAAWASAPGSYAEAVALPAAGAVPVPAAVELETAAALMLQGMTAHYLSHSTFPLQPGQTALVHAAAGGVGQILVQLARARGARVLGTVSTAEKARIAENAGADAVIRYTEVNFREEALRLTGGDGVDVVYDSVGKDTFDDSLGCLKPRGMLVLFGQSSGAVPPVDPQRLNTGGSLFLTRPTLKHYTADPGELRGRAEALFAAVAAGDLKIRIDRTFPLAAAADAHRYLEARRTLGKVLLLP
jgi:NADPH2:quinone reductase